MDSRSLRVLRAAAALGLVFGFGACAREREVVIENDAHPAPVEILVDGRSIGTFSGAEIPIKVPIWTARKDGGREKFDPDRGRPLGGKIRVRAQTACGPVTFGGKDPGDPPGSPERALRFRSFEADLNRAPGREPLDLEFEEVWFDNRGGPAARLQVGSFTYPIPAGAVGRRGVPAALCPAEQAVLLDGKRIGTFTAVAQRFTDSGALMQRGAFLVDTSGKRCYVETRFDYGLGGWAPPASTVRGKALHWLDAPHVDHFLEKAPEVIGSVTGGGSRVQVVECAP